MRLGYINKVLNQFNILQGEIKNYQGIGWNSGAKGFEAPLDGSSAFREDIVVRGNCCMHE